MSDRTVNALVIALALAVLACTLFVIFASFAHGVGAEAPQSPQFTARWASSTIAVMRWQQPADVRLTCLYRLGAHGASVLIRCWEDLMAGATWTALGDTGPLDYTAHPAAGDTYLLTLDDREERAELLSLLWMPIVRR